MISDYLCSLLRTYGDRTAIENSSGDWVISYNELFNLAEVFSNWAEQHQGSIFVFYGDKSKDYYLFAVSCFAYGISFCPIDVYNPIDKLLDIVEQLDNAIIITDSKEHYELLKSRQQSVFLFNHVRVIEEAMQDKSTSLSEISSSKHSPEYFIATSGSTGKPKIVRVPHESTMDFVRWSISFYCIDSNTKWAQFSSIGFDLSIVDLLTVICGGGTLVAISGRYDRSRPARTIEKSGITHWHSVPSIIPYILSDCANESGTCRLFTFCGEPLSTIDVENLAAHYPKARIVNTYGPTEGTLFCSYYEYVRGENIGSSTLPIGRPIPGWDFIFLDEKDSLRLIIVSKNVANGYVGTASEQFRRLNIFGVQIPAFDTGDFFVRKDGNLFFSHRVDGMIKINGNRVDLGDVEATCRRIGLQSPVALFTAGKIVVFVEGDTEDKNVLRQKLSNLLPMYSVPSLIISHTMHPRTSNGKVDRGELIKSIN